MTATAAVGDGHIPFQYMKTTQPTLLFTEEAKCPNKINHHKKKQHNTASCTYHHIGKTVEKPMAAATSTYHREQQPPIDIATTREIQHGFFEIFWKEIGMPVFLLLYNNCLYFRLTKASNANRLCK